MPATSSAMPGRRNRPWQDADAFVDLESLVGDAAHLGEGVRVAGLVVEGRDHHHLAARQGAAILVAGHPGESVMTLSWSSVSELSISVVAPPRMMMAFMGEPESTSVSSKPLAMASMATKTATTPAMPSTATRFDGPPGPHASDVVDQRDGHGGTLREDCGIAELRNCEFEKGPKLGLPFNSQFRFRNPNSFSYPPQRIHDAQPHGEEGGKDPGGHAHGHGEKETERHVDGGKVEEGEHAPGGVAVEREELGRQEAEDPALERVGQGFGEDEPEDRRRRRSRWS